MPFSYIDENLTQILQNPDSVLYLKPYDVGKKRALFAILKEGQGIYKKIQITKEQSKGDFPWEPIYQFFKGPGYLYFNNFIVMNHNWIALNLTNLEGFKEKILSEKFYKIAIYALFNDGSATLVTREGEKKFQKQGGINAYLDLLKKYKKINTTHETYQWIDGYVSESETTVIVPELQEEKTITKEVETPEKNDRLLISQNCLFNLIEYLEQEVEKDKPVWYGDGNYHQTSIYDGELKLLDKIKDLQKKAFGMTPDECYESYKKSQEDQPKKLVKKPNENNK